MTAAAVLPAVFFCLFSGCAKKEEPLPPPTESTETAPPNRSPQQCLDATYFLGDSNTSHLAHKDYSAICGIVEKERIWSGKGNTLMLDIGISVEDPITKEIKPLKKIAEETKPEFLVVTLGYNGFSSPTVSKERKESLDRLFKKAYEKLIDDIVDASPNTVILIQSIFPVTKGSEIKDPASVNARIDELNVFLKNIAKNRGISYLDTQSVLKDPATNCLKNEYSSSGSFYHTDGYHLSDVGLLAVLNYIKENAY